MLTTLRAARRVTGVPTLLVTVAIARLGVPSLTLAMLLAAREASGDYRAAAGVSAAFALAAAVSQLLWGRLADRHGARRVLQIAVVAQGFAFAGFALLAHRDAPVAPLTIAAALAGVCFPPMGTVSRAAWQNTHDEETRRALFALDGLTTELTLILGPLLASGLVAVGGGPFAVAAGATMVTGSVLVGARSKLLPSGARCGLRRRLVAAPPASLLLLLGATVAMAAALGAATVSGVALAEVVGLPAGLPLTLMAIGGVGGVLAWSSREVRMSRHRQLVLGLLIYAAAVAAVAAAPIAAALLLIVAAGGVMAPCDALQAQLCGEAAPPDRMSESFAWLNSANWIGYAAGMAASGSVVDAIGVPGGFGTCAASAIIAAALIALGRRRAP